VRTLALALVALLAGPAFGAGKGASFGEYVRAARAIHEWRYEEARALTAGLEKAAPDAPETRFLVAQMAFLDGDYVRAEQILADLDDPDVRAVVDDLKPLVTATRETVAGFERRESEHFVITYPPGRDEVLVELALDALEAAWKEIGGDLGYRPPEKVRVEILSRTTDLARVSTLSEKDIETSGTIALCKYGKLMVVSPGATLYGYPWLDTLAHEYTHYVVSRATGDRVPIWLHEGIAKFQESRWRAPAPAPLGRAHEGYLARALKKGRLVTFEEMHPSMAKLPSQEAAATAFAEVHSLLAWLHGQIGYPGIRQILQRTREGKSERRAVSEVVGKSWQEVEAAWKQHIRGLKLVDDARPKRSAKIRFKKGGKQDRGGEENLGLEEVREERARKHARLGGLLRARGRSAAAAVEYEKAMAISGPDDVFVAGKLARTYLDLGEAKKAIAVAEPLAARDEDDAYPRATLGAAWLKLGEAAKAEPHLLAAVRISPFDPAVRCGLFEVYTATNRATLAEREQRACRALQR
jgi:tetratricopeptide (TPR) repeat protein